VDVEAGGGHRGRYLAEHVRHVGIGDADAVIRFARHRDVGEVDRVTDAAIFEKLT
jgi:hypothetical protein